MKKISDIKEGDIIYQYGIGNLPDKGDFAFKRTLTVYKSKFAIVGLEDFGDGMVCRHIIKANEGKVFRNIVWLTEEDDEKAYEILTNAYNRRIEALTNQIDVLENRKGILDDFFKRKIK